jgi:phosphatidylinositol alpha-1,6-mannosyltransferase
MTADVLLIANNFPPVRGGSAAVYASLARAAAPRILVLAPRLSYTDGLPLIGWREHDRQAPFRVVRLDLLRTTIGAPRSGWQRAGFVARDLVIRGRLAGAVLRLLRLLRRERPRTVCIGELLASGWLLRLLRLLPGVRTLVYVHGEEITTDDPYDPGRRRCRRALAAADGIVVVSRFTEASVLALLGPQAAGKIRLIENGVDAARFTPGPKRADLLARFGLAGRFVFVSVCRLLEKKGIDQAIRAFARIHAMHPGTRYVIVGTGPYQQRLIEIAAEHGVADSVIFAGDVTEDDLVAHYCLGDVFVMPNRELANGDTEGFGLVFLEANGCGLPVIAGRDGGSRDAVQHGVNGLVVDGASVEAVAEAMTLLLNDGLLRARLAEGAARISQAADWSHKTATFMRICEGEQVTG